MSKNKASQTGPAGEQDIFSRRAFVSAALGGVGICYAAALGYPVYRYLSSPAERAAMTAAVTEITLQEGHKLAKGSALIFKFGTKPAMLIHHLDDTWVALDAVCTHLGCTVSYEAAKNRIYCGCHGGVYDPRTGGNVSGPPPKPLKKYIVTISETGAHISRG